MKSTTKSQTLITKFEEFFATSYKDDVFEILETYPDNRSLTLDYNILEILVNLHYTFCNNIHLI